MSIFSNFFACVKKRIGFFAFLVVLTVVAIVLGVIAAINFDGAIVSIDLANVVYIKFLQGNCGVVFFIFGSILSVAVYFMIVLLCCSKRFLFPLAILFYLYMIYSQAVIFMSILLIYGIFNALILLLVLLVYIILLALLFMLIITESVEICDSPFYFKSCFNRTTCILIYSMALLILAVVLCILIWILKSFVILLVY